MGTIIYNKLLIMMAQKGLTTYKIRKDKIISESTLQNIRENKSITTDSIASLCEVLNCQPGDLMEYVPDTLQQKKERENMALPKAQIYTIDDIYNLPEGSRAELIDGQIYYMAPPSRIHQDILSFLHLAIGNYLSNNNVPCKIYPAPFAVFIDNEEDKDQHHYVEPDISVICSTNKLNDRGCNGAPDWIIEIVSPSSKRLDYYTKPAKYRAAGVREYWIVDPIKQTILVYNMENDDGPTFHAFTDSIKVNIYNDLYIDFSKLDI